MFKLKKGQESFQVVDGPDAGKTFRRGVAYDHIPTGEERRFEPVSAPKASPVKTKTKQSKENK